MFLVNKLLSARFFFFLVYILTYFIFYISILECQQTLDFIFATYSGWVTYFCYLRQIVVSNQFLAPFLVFHYLITEMIMIKITPIGLKKNSTIVINKYISKLHSIYKTLEIVLEYYTQFDGLDPNKVYEFN